MGLKTAERKSASQPNRNVFADIGFEDGDIPSLAAVQLAYLERTSSIDDGLYVEAAKQVIWANFVEQSTKREEASLASSVISDREKEKNEKGLKALIDGVSKLHFPDTAKAAISQLFINHALDDEQPISPISRQLAADIGLAVSGENASILNVGAVKKVYIDASSDTTHKKGVDSESRSKVAVTILKAVGDQPVLTIKEPRIDTIVRKIQQNAKGLAAAATTGIVATSVGLSSTSAYAVEPAPTPTPQATTHQGEQSSLAVTLNKSQNKDVKPETISIGATPNAPSPSSISVTLQKTVHTEPKPTAPSSPNTPSPISTSPDSSSSSVNNTPQVISITPDTPAGSSTDQIEVKLAPVSPSTPNVAPTPAQPDGTPSASVPAPVVTIPIQSPDSTTNTNSSPNTQQPLTPEQKTDNLITNALTNGSDINSASYFIQRDFGTNNKISTELSSSYSSVVQTNPGLSDLKKLESTLVGVIKSNGHAAADASYVSNSLMAISVLDAMANDQSVRKTDQVQNLIKNIQPPTDPYQARIFAQYFAAAKTSLEASTNPLMTGMTNADDIKHVETVYAFAAMASASDAELAAAKQKLIDEDKAAADKAAAEKAAADKAAADKAAADAAAAKAAEQANGGIAPETQAIQDMINSTSGVEQRKYQAMQLFMGKGLTAMQAAAIVGNLAGESGMDPTKAQYDGGIGRFLAQWSVGGSRYNGLVAYAASVNKPVTDFTVQLEYIWIELTGKYRAALDELKAAQNLTDAVTAIQTKYEITYASLYRGSNPQRFINERNTRVSLVQGEYNAYENQVAALNAAAEKAAAAAKAAADAKAIADAKIAAEAKAAAAAETQSNSQKIVAAAQAELAKWVGGIIRPIANGGPDIGTYLIYSENVHTNWCAYFVTYVLEKAGLTVPEPDGYKDHAVVRYLKSALLSTEKYTWHDPANYTPKPGDIAFYGNYDHVNIVISATSPDNFNTIGGNQGYGSAPSFASKYNGKGAYAYGRNDNAYTEAYVKEDKGAAMGMSYAGFLSPN